MPIAETMAALHDVVKAGKALYIGASRLMPSGPAPQHGQQPAAQQKEQIGCAGVEQEESGHKEKAAALF